MQNLIQAGATQSLAFAASYVAMLVLLGLALSIRVIQTRRSQLIGLGDGEDRDLRRRIRAHGNYSEYAPLMGLMLLALPLLGAREWLIHAIAVPGLVGRLLHAIGLSRSAGPSFGRVGGMILTLGSLTAGAVALLVLAWR